MKLYSVWTVADTPALLLIAPIETIRDIYQINEDAMTRVQRDLDGGGITPVFAGMGMRSERLPGQQKRVNVLNSLIEYDPVAGFEAKAVVGGALRWHDTPVG